MTDPVIGRRLFTDGIERDVYLAPDGRQYVLDDHDLPAFGVWQPDNEGEPRSPGTAPAATH
jgi:hypothetical protein